jgi:hypothetical protein
MKHYLPVLRYKFDLLVFLFKYFKRMDNQVDLIFFLLSLYNTISFLSFIIIIKVQRRNIILTPNILTTIKDIILTPNILTPNLTPKSIIKTIKKLIF